MATRTGSFVWQNSQAYRQILRELDDWNWDGRCGRRRKVLPPDVARRVLKDVEDQHSINAIVKKYHRHFPFSRPWLINAVADGSLQRMADGHSELICR